MKYIAYKKLINPPCNGWEPRVLFVLRDLEPFRGIEFSVRMKTLTKRTGLPKSLVAYTLFQLAESGKISCRLEEAKKKKRQRSWLIRLE